MARHVFSCGIRGGLVLTLAMLLIGLSGCGQGVGETVQEKVQQGQAAKSKQASDSKATSGAKNDRQSRKELDEALDEWGSTWNLDEEEGSEEGGGESSKIEASKAEGSKKIGEEAGKEPEGKQREVEVDVEEPVLTEEEVVEVIEEPRVELGDPLVDNLLENFVPLQENRAAWVSKKKKQVVMVGRVVQRNAPLEMFVCQKNTKEHESVLMVDTQAEIIHAALLLIGAEPGHPVRFQPEYKPATGTTIAIDVVWKDEEGKLQRAKAQEWIKNVQTNKPLDHNWVFAGSGFWEDKETGQRMYLANHGDFICVSNFPTAMLDLPIKSSDREEALLFQAWEERVPPLDTPVTIIMTPKVEK